MDALSQGDRDLIYATAHGDYGSAVELTDGTVVIKWPKDATDPLTVAGVPHTTFDIGPFKSHIDPLIPGI
jgi:hypothetical protein